MKQDLTVILGSSVDIFYDADTYPEEGDFSHGRDAGISAGGCPLNVGCVAGSKGIRVAALDYLKRDDDATRIILSALQKNGVSSDHIILADDCTDGKVVIIRTGDKRTMFVIDPERPKYNVDEKMQDLLNNSTYIYSLMHIIERSFDSYEYLFEAKRHGAKVIFDGSSKYDDPRRSELLLSVADGLFINETDYARLSESIERDAAEALLERGAEFVCVTEGSRGATCHTREKVWRAESVHLSEVVDSTGAGDAFAGGFLFGRVRGYDYETCLRLACVSGAYGCMHESGLGGCCSEEELMRFAKECGYEVNP